MARLILALGLVFGLSCRAAWDGCEVGVPGKEELLCCEERG